MRKFSVLTALLQMGCLLSVSCLKGQDEMNVDLADQAISPQLLQRGQAQAELAISYTKFFSEEKTECINPIATVRFGLARNVELGLTAEEGVNRDIFAERSAQGLYPLALSNKIRFFRNENSTVSFISVIQLPFTAQTKRKSGYWSPMFVIAWERKIGETLKLTFNSGIKQQPFDASWQVPVNVAAEAKLNELLTVFANYYSQFPFHDLPQHNAGLGVEIQLTKDLEVFFTGGRSIYADDANGFVAGGLAFRLGR